MRLKHSIFVIFAITALVAINGPQSAEASFWDSFPIISQIKSAFQALAGDTEGAKKTQENFLNQAVGISQIKSLIEDAGGYHDAARRTQEQFWHERLEPILDNTPVVGHIKGGIHMAVGDTERGEQILKAASSTTAAVLGGIVAGPVGAFVGGVVGDGIISAADSIKNNNFSGYGMIDYFANFDHVSAGDHFDVLLGLGMDAFGEKIAKTGGKNKINEPSQPRKNGEFGADAPNERHLDGSDGPGRIPDDGASHHNEPGSSANHAQRRLDPANPHDFEIIRQRLGLPEEYARFLEPIDFRLINDKGGRMNCYQCSLAATMRKTVSELHQHLKRELPDAVASVEGIKKLYIEAGFTDTRVEILKNIDDMIKVFDTHLRPNEHTQFSLGFIRKVVNIGHVVHMKMWKNAAGKLFTLTVDFQRAPNERGRFSGAPPADAKIYFIIHPGVVRLLPDLENPNLSVFFGSNQNGKKLSGTPLYRKFFEPNKILERIMNAVSGNIDRRHFSESEHIESLRRKQIDGGHKCIQRRRIIGYVPHWSSRPFSFEQSLNLTNAIYAFVEMSSNGSLEIPDTSMAKERLLDLILTRAAHNEERLSFKVSFAVGGWVNSQYFSSVLNDGDQRSFFIREIERIIVAYKFDGVDIDWEYPGTGGATEGIAEDKQNYVTFLRELREKLGSDRLISIAGGAGQEAFAGFDVPNILKYVDWISVMTYDFNGAWDSQWGAFVGPNAPLYHAAPPGYSGKLNVNWAIKQYVCVGGQPHKIIMGIPFYGRYWYLTMPGPKADYPLYRKAELLSNGSYGDAASYRQIMHEWHINNNPRHQTHWDDRSKTPWMTDGKMVLSYDNERSILEKVQYANSHNLGGVMIWSVDQDDLSYSLLRTVFDNSCYASVGAGNTFKCNPLGTEKRWWTWLEDKQKAGMCGRNAPLYNGFYALCDPDDPGYSCCSAHGYCGSGSVYCDCPNCVDYGKNPDLLIQEPTKPSRLIEWHIGFDLAKVGQPRCGSIAPKLANGKEAICNPDGNDYCCSSAGYCGSGRAFCECNGCVNHRTGVRTGTPRQISPSTSSSQLSQSQKLIQPIQKRWYTWTDGPLAGRCGSRAPKINGDTAICNPRDSAYHCCSSAGYCGTGSRYCECRGCVNYAT